MLINFYLFFSCYSVFYHRSFNQELRRVEGKFLFLPYIRMSVDSILVRVLQRNRTYRMCVCVCVCVCVYLLQTLAHTDMEVDKSQDLLSAGWRPGKAGVSFSLSLKAQELGAPMSKGRRWSSQPRKKESICSSSTFLLHSDLTYCKMLTHIGEGGSLYSIY